MQLKVEYLSCIRVIQVKLCQLVYKSILKWCHSSKHFSDLYAQDGGKTSYSRNEITSLAPTAEASAFRQPSPTYRTAFPAQWVEVIYCEYLIRIVNYKANFYSVSFHFVSLGPLFFTKKHRSGVLSCWPDGLELTPGFYPGSNEQHRLF